MTQRTDYITDKEIDKVATLEIKKALIYNANRLAQKGLNGTTIVAAYLGVAIDMLLEAEGPAEVAKWMRAQAEELEAMANAH